MGKSKKQKWRKGKGAELVEQVEDTKAQKAKEKRLLGDALEDIADEDLFVVDTERTSTKRQKRLDTGSTWKRPTLRNEAILLPNSNIAALKGADKAKKFVVEQRKKSKKTPTSMLTLKQRKQLIKIANKKITPKLKNVQNFDLWGDDTTELSRLGVVVAKGNVHKKEKWEDVGPKWFGTTKAKEVPVGRLHTAQKQKKREQYSARRTRASEVHAAVVAPAAGASFNPDERNRKELINKAIETELGKRSEERFMKKKAPIIKKLINSVQDRLTDPSDMADPEIERRIAAVMMGEAHVGIGYEALDDVTRRQGAHPLALKAAHENEDTESESDEDDTAEQGSAPRRLARGERLTQSQRNKKMRNKAAQVELQKAKKAKKVKQMESRILHTNKEVKKIVAARAKSNVARKQARDDAESDPKRLGKYLYKEAATEVALEDELRSGSMRAMSVKGSLLRDRLQAMQKRNIIEPRRRVGQRQRRYKLKQYTTHAGRPLSFAHLFNKKKFHKSNMQEIIDNDKNQHYQLNIKPKSQAAAGK